MSAEIPEIGRIWERSRIRQAQQCRCAVLVLAAQWRQHQRHNTKDERRERGPRSEASVPFCISLTRLPPCISIRPGRLPLCRTGYRSPTIDRLPQMLRFGLLYGLPLASPTIRTLSARSPLGKRQRRKEVLQWQSTISQQFIRET